MRISDWSSDVCSSDLVEEALVIGIGADHRKEEDHGKQQADPDAGQARENRDEAEPEAEEHHVGQYQADVDGVDHLRRLLDDQRARRQAAEQKGAHEDGGLEIAGHTQAKPRDEEVGGATCRGRGWKYWEN